MKKAKLTNKQTKEIERFSLAHYKKLGFSHGRFHAQTTVKLAEKIAKSEKADLEIVRAGALLHQIHNSGAVRTFLRKIGVDAKTRERIAECVYKYRADTLKKERSLEANIVYDADTLQILGTFGVVRLLAIGIEERGMNFIEAMRWAKDMQRLEKSLKTKSARRLLRDRKVAQEFLKEFFGWIDR